MVDHDRPGGRRGNVLLGSGETRRMRILLLNTHSTLNSGDTGIVLAQIHILRKRFSDLQISLTSRTPEIDARFYEPMGIRVFPAIVPAPSVFVGWVEKLEGSLENLFAFQSKSELLREIKGSDLIVSSGGGCFYSNRKLFPGPMFFQNLLHQSSAVH